MGTSETERGTNEPNEGGEMTQDDIIRLAREAGWRVDSEGEVLEGDGWHIQTDIVECFAKLVAEAERKECAKICGRIADSVSYESSISALKCYEAIRARGQV